MTHEELIKQRRILTQKIYNARLTKSDDLDLLIAEKEEVVKLLKKKIKIEEVHKVSKSSVLPDLDYNYIRHLRVEISKVNGDRYRELSKLYSEHVPYIVVAKFIEENLKIELKRKSWRETE